MMSVEPSATVDHILTVGVGIRQLNALWDPSE